MTSVDVRAVPVIPRYDCTVCGPVSPARWQVGSDRESRWCTAHVGQGLVDAARLSDGWLPITVKPIGEAS